EAGPPGAAAVELARVVDRSIREANAIDVKKLCMEPGEKVWVVSIDVCTINADGNLIDASALAAIAAIQQVKFPTYDGKKVNYKELTKEKLPIKKVPIAVTVIKMDSQFLVDPTTEEEEVADARLTVSVTEEGNLCAMQKGGDQPLTVDDVDKMVGIAIEKAAELRKVL
ncbi:RNA-binding protein, partial [Candidatus Woesearchaeota archaeon]|nr:RNA-binding protein [Candidatus Woesearchaeota archaeon]